MKKLLVALSAALLAATSFAGTAEARPGHGHAYGHYKPHHVRPHHARPWRHHWRPHHRSYGYRWHHRHHRGYYASPAYRYHTYRHRSSNAAIAAGVTGAIVGGAIAASR